MGAPAAGAREATDARSGRRLDPELIDAPELPLETLEHSLRQVAAVNRWLGGERSLQRHLTPLRRERIRVLDVGTGNGVSVRRLVAWAGRAGGRWSAVGLELHPQVLAIARDAARVSHGGPTLVRGDALHLPFRSGSFDVAICTLTLHHFGDRDAAHLLSELARVARRLVLVSDLERHRLAYLSARLLALTWWRGNPLTRSDGPHSVLRSFTREELAHIGHEAGLERSLVRRHFPFRLVLEARL